jgi:hypothetical protein
MDSKTRPIREEATDNLLTRAKGKGAVAEIAVMRGMEVKVALCHAATRLEDELRKVENRGTATQAANILLIRAKGMGAVVAIRALEVNVASGFKHEFKVDLEVIPAANICLTRMKVRVPSRRCGP